MGFQNQLCNLYPYGKLHHNETIINQIKLNCCEFRKSQESLDIPVFWSMHFLLEIKFREGKL